MSAETLAVIKDLVGEVGVPAALIFLGCLGMWRFGRFMAPLITKWVEKNIEFQDSIELTIKTQTVILEANTTLLKDVHTQMAMLSPLVSQVADRHIEFLDSLYMPSRFSRKQPEEQ